MPSPTPPDRPPLPPAPLRRLTLNAARGAGWAMLDALRCDDGMVRLFLAAGTPADRFAPGEGLAEARDVGGAALLVLRDQGPEVAVALLDGATLRATPAAADTAFLAGLNVLVALRTVETPRQCADWLGYHQRFHGAGAAVIVNRAEAGHEAFAAALAAALAARGIAAPVVLVDCPLPLGKPGAPSEAHPLLAPDAPGKDRMDPPAPDPWEAPLGEALIYEILKWRLLARARAVLALDASDILAERAEGEDDAFDRCLASGSGAVLLAGTRIYPWRLRPGQEEGFADHICRPFDNRRGIPRWGVAPARAGLDKTWRPTRIAYAAPDPVAVPFWRAMGLRVPGRRPSELAPKTSLIEDPALVALAARAFAGRPVRAPVSRPKPALGRSCIVTTMKNEGPFILEWIAHHRAAGIDDFLIYSNDCTDGTDRLLDALDRAGVVTHRDNPYRGSALTPQHAALQAAEDEPVVRRSGWILCSDVDEFINIRIGDGRLPALFEAMEASLPGANMIALTWRLFGNSDLHDFDGRFVTEAFTRCAPELVRKPHQAWGFKTLFRNIDIFRKLGVHRPKGLRPDLWTEVRWLNGSGRPMPREMFRNGWRSTADTYGYDWVALNHYAVRSAESFLVKRDRGRVNHVDRDQGVNYWFRMNHNAVEDRSIQRMLPATRAEFDRLMALPGVGEAQEACLDAHRRRIAELRAQPHNAALYAELTGARMERLSRMLHVFGAAVFSAGPGVIPPDLHLTDPPPGFFFTTDWSGEAAH